MLIPRPVDPGHSMAEKCVTPKSSETIQRSIRLPRVLLVGSPVAADSMESHVMDSLQQLGCEVQTFSMRHSFDRLPLPVRRAADKAATLLLREPERLFERQLLRRLA